MEINELNSQIEQLTEKLEDNSEKDIIKHIRRENENMKHK